MPIFGPMWGKKRVFAVWGALPIYKAVRKTPPLPHAKPLKQEPPPHPARWVDREADAGGGGGLHIRYAEVTL